MTEPGAFSRETILAQLGATGPLELVAVLLGLVYVVLAIRQVRACWLAGGLSAALYVLVFLESRLYLQSGLQLVYVAMAASGWMTWGREAGRTAGLLTRSWSPSRHVTALAGVALATLVTAPLLAHGSDSVAPWADALGTWASVAATWMMIRRVAAAWLWWIVIDTGLAWLFAAQGLPFTAALYLVFAALAVAGWWQWQRAPQVATDHV